MGEALMTVGDASRILDITPATVKAAAKAGKLRVEMRTVGGIYLFKRADVERFKQEREERAAMAER